MEVRHYELLLKRARVESMKNEINKLSLKETNLNPRDRDGQVVLARHREMLKIVVPDFKRGNADEVLCAKFRRQLQLRAEGDRATSRPWLTSTKHL